jgi:hypothetical protein
LSQLNVQQSVHPNFFPQNYISFLRYDSSHTGVPDSFIGVPLKVFH